MKNLILFVLLFASIGASAQNQDANPYGGIYYNDNSNYRMSGANGLPRTDHANIDTLTNVLKGDLRFDTLNAVVVVYNGTAWVNLEGGGNNLDEAYDKGGAGVGRTITADGGAVKIDGADGFLITGTFGSGADSEWVGGGAYDVGMFFNPKKGAFRAGFADGTQWDDSNIGQGSTAFGGGSIASGFGAFVSGSECSATGENSTAIGNETLASGSGSTASGLETIASGIASNASGNFTTSKSFAETALGTYNTDYTPTSTTAWSATDRLLVVGNGANSGELSDAMIILKNGKTTLPSVTGSFTPNVLTTTQRDALTATAGMMIYNSTTSKHQGYDGSTWNDLY